MITGGGVPHHERRLNNSDHLVHCLRSEAESRVVIIVMVMMVVTLVVVMLMIVLMVVMMLQVYKVLMGTGQPTFMLPTTLPVTRIFVPLDYPTRSQ